MILPSTMLCRVSGHVVYQLPQMLSYVSVQIVYRVCSQFSQMLCCTDVVYCICFHRCYVVCLYRCCVSALTDGSLHRTAEVHFAAHQTATSTRHGRGQSHSVALPDSTDIRPSNQHLNATC